MSRHLRGVVALRRAAAIFAPTFALAACGGARGVPVGHSDGPVHTVRPLAPRAQELFVAAPGDRLIGPRSASLGDRTLVAWVESGEAGRRRLRTLVTDARGVPLRSADDVVPSAGDVTALVVKATTGGFVMAWTVLADRGAVLRTVPLTLDGLAAAAPVEVTRTVEDIVWTEIVATRRGHLLVWAEETAMKTANVLALSLDVKGAARGVPSFVVRGVVGWQATPWPDGALLALLRPIEAKAKKGGPPLPPSLALSLLPLTVDGTAAAAPVDAPAPVGADLTLVRTQAGAALAWTDESGVEPEVKGLVVDEKLRLSPARAFASPAAGAKLVSLAPLARDAVVVYEEATRDVKSSRRVLLARFEAGGARTPTVLELEGASKPELVPFGDGAALLARARVCERGEDDAACQRAPFVPAALELDAALRVARVERVEAADTKEPVELAWGLACPASCVALGLAPSKGGEPGQRVLAAPLFAGGVVRRALVSPLYAEGRPRPRGATTVLRTEPVAQLALTRASGQLVAAVLSRGEGGAVAKAAAGASLHRLALAADGATTPATVATRAAGYAGVALATAPDGGTALAWVSREDGGARVHLTRFAPDGKKVGDVLVTTRKGEVASANVVAVEGGYVVAWVDPRDGQGEVYAAKVTSDLARVGEHQRITTAPGDATDLSAVAHPSGVVWLAWSDPRENPREGKGDLYVATVRAKDARKVGDEVRVLASAAHSRSPSLAVSGDGVAVAWIEEAPIGADVEAHVGYGALVAWLDARLHVSRDPLRLRGAGPGVTSGVLLDAKKGGAAGLLLRGTKEELALDAFTTENGAVVASWLLTPAGPPTLDVPLALDGSDVVYAEEGRSGGEHRVRRVVVDWDGRGR